MLVVILVVVEVRLLEILVVDRNASGNISRSRSKTASSPTNITTSIPVYY